LAFILSMAGVSLCVMNKVQFSFAVDKAAFVKRYSTWMELPSTLLILSGVTLMAGVCARVFALYDRWVAHVIVSLAAVIFPALLLLWEHEDIRGRAAERRDGGGDGARSLTDPLLV
jgi:uncharacterized membrane protein SirB2